MFAADLVTPAMTTDGTPTPTGVPAGTPPAPLIARVTVRAIARTTSDGVDGLGVRTRRRGATSTPFSTSTTPTLIPLPPTSTPIATVGAAAGASIAILEV